MKFSQKNVYPPPAHYNFGGHTIGLQSIKVKNGKVSFMKMNKNRQAISSDNFVMTIIFWTDQMAEWYRASASESVDLGFDSESDQTNDLKIAIHSFPAWRLVFKGQCGERRQVYLLCRWERHLTEFPHLGVVDRWPATPKRARIAHWSLSRDRRINMPIIIIIILLHLI